MRPSFAAAAFSLCLGAVPALAAPTTSEAKDGQAVPAPEKPADQRVAAPTDAFCRSVATQDAHDSGGDPATQARVAERSYQQCMLIYRR